MTTTSSGTTVLTFQETELDIVDIHNIPWLRLPQIGAALGYANQYHLQKVYAANADEFTDEMTRLMELPTAGGLQQVRIFSPRGCYLIGMLSRTDKAKEFRKWVLDVLEGRELPKEIGRMTIPQQIGTHRLRIALLRELKAETAPGIRRALHAQVAHVSRLLALPVPAITEIGRDVVQHELAGV